MQRITPCLWYQDQAEEAVNFYLSIFNDSQILTTTRYGEVGPGDDDAVMVIEFELSGQKFVALNGRPPISFNESISHMISCETAEEVDHYWEKLSAGGEKSYCGWLKDKFGVSWQVVPTRLMKMMTDPDQGKAQMVMAAMMQMQKLDIDALQTAYNDA